jgi:thioredoxin-like negative regulator of GroEL
MFILDVVGLEQLQNLVMAQEKPVALFTYVEGDESCAQVSQALDEVFKDFYGSMYFAKIRLNADEYSVVARDLAIMAVPAIVMIVNGAPKDILYGSNGAEDLRNYFRKFLAEK